MIRVHICGRPLLARGLEQIFEGTNFAVSESAHFGPSQPSSEHPAPELFIVDGKFCPMEMVELISELKALNSQARLILLSDELDANAALAACNAGADGICLTNSSHEVLMRSIELVMLGEVVVSSELMLGMIATPESQPEPELEPSIEAVFQPAPKRLLSNREVEVLTWLKEGAPNKVIARKLNVAEATVKVHVKAILKKIRVCNRAQAAIWAAHHLSLEAVGPFSDASNRSMTQSHPVEPRVQDKV
jgi:two-component system nitrate/nitrite response regulator NarL